MRFTALPDGEKIPAFGLGTWRMGESRAVAAAELAALKLGLDLGVTLIDTAEMYGNGRAEEIVGAAIAGRREKLFLVSKVLPENASRRGTIAACEASLQRLKTDRLDLYLLHWRGSVPLAETLAAFAQLQQAGKIRHWGVSNFDVADMEDLAGAVPASNQVLYNLARRGGEWALMPWCRARRIPIMAYSPIEQGRILGNKDLRAIAAARGKSPAQMALAWVLSREATIVIPKATDPDHVREDVAALDIALSPNELAAFERAFPPPKRATGLETL